jgi:N-acetylmuramoyl-L-alanine amidase
MVILLDPGHGGISNGVYQTPGKRSPIWPNKTQLFEGEFNRAIVKRLMLLCDRDSIAHVNIVPDEKDTALQVRVARANDIYKKERNCIYISIHADAFSNEAANGFSVFTTPGQTKSDLLATSIINSYKRNIPNIRLRSDMKDGDQDKEENFYVIKNTLMPAVLVECGFMTNFEECQFLLSEDGRDEIADAIYEGIKDYINNAIFN